MDWYQLSIKETLQKLQATEDGLSNDEARERIKHYGPNKLAEEEKISRIKIFLHQFTSPLIYILLVAAVVTFLLEEYIDTAVIVGIVIINAIVGYIQEYKAEESVRALRKMVVPKARVLRNGKEKEIYSEELVPGDIVLLASGVKVPADIRLVKTIELRVEEAMLTGESIPAEKMTAPIKDDNLTPGDQKNMAFMGTIVVSGRAKGIVVETGSGTVLGSIAREVREISATKAPLQKKIERFAKVIGLITLIASALLFTIGLIVGESVKDMFMTAVAATVATIPEGLPIVVTVAMAIGVARMARQNAIVRKLHAAETLGSTTVICSDKTGTLTKNEMTVKLIYDGEHTYEITGSGYEPVGEILRDGMHIESKEKKALLHVLRIGLLCNESDIYQENHQYKIEGDPTEGALIISSMKAGLSQEEEKKHYPQIAIVPFESERGYMATLHKHGGKRVLFVKGAPERVLDMCTGSMSVDTFDKKEMLHIATNFAKEGLRVLAFAYREVSYDTEEITHHDIESGGLILAGFQGMMDPPRPEAIEAIKGCKKAGIRVVMITGDHAVTAKAIAKELDIADENADVLTGKELNGMDNSTLFEKVKTISVYARVSPEHKLRIVQQLKKHGEIVAVTGDGVNDAPALKEAHLGIAMGKTGTDVAKEASDMVLADDNFATIFNAVKEGRILFDNIRKVVFFLIPTGIAAILSIIATIILGIPMPYVPTQLLWLNIVTNGLQDIALAFEPGEKGVIDRPPREPEEGIMSRILIERTILVSIVISAGVIFNFISALYEGVSIEKARTTALTTMVFFQFFQAWNSRSERLSVFQLNPIGNPFLFYSMVAAVFAQLAVLYVPSLQLVFRTQPLTPNEWIHVGIASITILVIIEIDKLIRRRRESTTAEPETRKTFKPAKILLPFFYVFLAAGIAYTFLKPKKEIEVVFSIGTGAKETQLIRSILQDFENKNPTIKVKLNILPTPADRQYDYYHSTLGAKTANIDVLSIDTTWTAEFASAGWLEPLGNYISRRSRNGFIPVTNKTDFFQGTMYAIPWNADIGLLYYRKDLLGKYNLSPPDTWEKLIDTCVEIMASQPIHGYLWKGRDYDELVCNFIEFIGSNNGEIIDNKGRVVVNSSQNRAALDLMHGLIWKHRVSPSNTTSEFMEGRSRDLFHNDRSLFLRDWTYSWDLSRNDPSMRRKVGIAQLPKFPDGKPGPVYAGRHLAINANSIKKAEAWKLVDFLTSRHTQKKLAIYLSWAPTRNVLYRDHGLLQRLPFLPIIKASFHNIRIRPNLPYYQRMSAVIQEHVSRVLSNQISSEQALQTIQAELEHIKNEFTQD